jgi:hypothetical protein
MVDDQRAVLQDLPLRCLQHRNNPSTDHWNDLVHEAGIASDAFLERDPLLAQVGADFTGVKRTGHTVKNRVHDSVEEVACQSLYIMACYMSINDNGHNQATALIRFTDFSKTVTWRAQNGRTRENPDTAERSWML